MLNAELFHVKQLGIGYLTNKRNGCIDAKLHAGVLEAAGMESEAFLKADAEMGAAAKRRREILGLPPHWMA